MSERSHRCRAACIEMKPGPYLGDGFWDQPPPLPKIFDIELSREKQALQNIQNDCYEGLSDSCRVHQIRFLPGLRPGPAGGAHDASPDPLVGWGGGHPSPFPTPLDAFGDSSSAPSAPRSQNPLRIFFLDTALDETIT